MKLVLDLSELGWDVQTVLNMSPERLIKLLKCKTKKKTITADEYIQMFGVV